MKKTTVQKSILLVLAFTCFIFYVILNNGFFLFLSAILIFVALRERNKDKKIVRYCGYIMTAGQAEDLKKYLIDDIVERYNTPEYYNPDIITYFADAHELLEE